MTQRNWSSSVDTMLDPEQAATGHFRGLVNQIKAAWDAGECPDALAVLAQHPELAIKKSLVVELAYEEFCQREEAGENIDVERFCSRFSDHRTSVRRRLQVHQFIEQGVGERPAKTLWPQPTQNFCGFQLCEEIGQGAIGRVYLATQAALGNRTVVLKVSKGGSREAHLLGRLQHPNVVPVYSVENDLESGLTTVCMPYLGLATFEDVLDQAAISTRRPTTAAIFPDTVRRLNGPARAMNGDVWARLAHASYVNGLLVQFEQVADALAYLHAKGICHRDLKPSNVLLADDGRPMLLDFNLSAELASADRRLGGTLPYMAPEQLQTVLGLPAKGLDARADIFAVGVMLFEMLAGRLPFGPVSKNLSMERAGKQLLDQQALEPDWAVLKEAGADPQVIAIIRRCLAFDPGDRFFSAADLARALRSALSPVARMKRTVQRNPLRSTLIGLLISAVISAASLFIALRPAEYERLFDQGREQYMLGEYEAAADFFKQSHEANSDFQPAILGLARTYLSLEDHRSAFDEYQRLYEKKRDPRVLASMGYCMNMLDKRREAIDYYSRALTDGYKSGSVLNNLGYSYLVSGSFDAARTYLNEALKLNRQCRTALHNRAMLELQWATMKKGKVPDVAVDDIEAAIQQGPASAGMHYAAACICCLSGRPDLLEAAVRHAERAIILGFDPEDLQREIALRPLQNNLRIQRMIQGQRNRPRISEPSRLIDPNPEL